MEADFRLADLLYHAGRFLKKEGWLLLSLPLGRWWATDHFLPASAPGRERHEGAKSLRLKTYVGNLSDRATPGTLIRAASAPRTTSSQGGLRSTAT